MADLEMRLIGAPEEIEAVVAEFRDEFSTDAVIKRISAPLPSRKDPHRVRVYIVLDGALLAEELRTPQRPQEHWKEEPCL